MKNCEKLKQKWVKTAFNFNSPALSSWGVVFITNTDGELLRTMFCLLSTFGKYDRQSASNDSRRDTCGSK